MNKHTIYYMLSVKKERDELIKSSKRNEHKTFDLEVEKFIQEFLRDWKEYDKETKLKFCEWLMDSEEYEKGQDYAFKKKEEIKQTIKKTPGNIKNKMIEVVKKFK